MGSTSSKIVQDDYKQKVNEIEEENVSEVVYSPSLIAKLEGRPMKSDVEEHESVMEPVMDQSQESENILKNPFGEEDREAEKIEKFIDEINLKQYNAPVHALPCTVDRQASVRCLKENSHNALACRDVVRQFTKCAAALQ